MECNRFVRLIKSWYLQVQDEALAPARMVSFMEKHVAECETCLGDPGIRGDVGSIIKIILPQSKTIKLTSSEQEEEQGPSDEDLDEIEKDEVGIDHDDAELEEEEDIDGMDIDEEFIDDDSI